MQTAKTLDSQVDLSSFGAHVIGYAVTHFSFSFLTETRCMYITCIRVSNLLLGWYFNLLPVRLTSSVVLVKIYLMTCLLYSQIHKKTINFKLVRYASGIYSFQ